MPSAFGLLVILLFIIAAIFRATWLIVLSSTIGILIIFAFLWQKQSLKNISYARKWHYRRGFPGEKNHVTIEVQNHKYLPLTWLKTSDPWSLAVPPSDPELLSPTHIPDEGLLVNHFSLRPMEKITRHFEIQFLRRGVHAVGSARLESGDLFGLFNTELELHDREYLTVFPALLPMENIPLSADDPFGDRNTRKRIFEDPNLPIGVRPYHPEDDFRRVHWPNSARTGSLQVKVFRPISSQILMVCLNVGSSDPVLQGISTPMLEQLTRVTATLLVQSVESNYSVGLISNGCMAHADQSFRIMPGKNKDQLGLLLSALAAVTAFTTAPFDKFLMLSSSRIPYGATLLIITPEVTPTLAQTLISLRRFRSHTTLISLDTTPPPVLPQIRTVHLPFFL